MDALTKKHLPPISTSSPFVDFFASGVNRSEIDLKKSINRPFFSDRPDRIEIDLKTKKNQ
jgi:hypothetical protein